jgi:hypothetical protein
MSNRKRKGIPEGIKSMPQMIAYFGIVRACRHVPAVIARKPVVLGLVVPEGQSEMYARIAGYIVDKKKWSFGSDAEVVRVDPDKRKRNRADYEISEATMQHERVVVVTESRDMLPSRFQLVADAVVDTPPMTARDVAAAARILFGMVIPHADAEFIAGLSLADLGGVFRKGRPLSVSLRMVRETLAAEQGKKDSGGPTLDDLHGLGAAGDWGRELAIDLADWRAGRIAWEDVERGILLSGAPGTGKTTFAGALARTCGVEIVTGSIAAWQSKGHMGDMLKAMYGAFAEAKSKAPAVLFIDEVDAIGDRETFQGEHVQYCTEVVNGFLECLDGVDGREGVVVVGACNHPDKLDAAIKRPGRLDRHVIIPLPDSRGREGILRWHLRGSLEGEDLSLVVERTEGWSGAALEQLVRQGRRTARRARRDMRLVDLAEELPALVPVPAASLWRSAVHEAGHAVVGLSLGHWDIVSAAVAPVVSQGTGSQQAGSVVFADSAIRQSSAEDYKARIARAMGGLAAEEAVFGHRTDGGGGIEGSDLYTATIAAAAMEVSLGLGGSLTLLATLDHERLLHLVQYDHVIRARVEKTLSECYETAKRIASERRGDIERLAHALCDKGKLSGAEVREIADAQPRLKLVSPSG